MRGEGSSLSTPPHPILSLHQRTSKNIRGPHFFLSTKLEDDVDLRRVFSFFDGQKLRHAFGGVARNSVNVWAGVLGSQAAAASLVFASEPRAPTLAPPASCLLPSCF